MTDLQKTYDELIQLPGLLVENVPGKDAVIISRGALHVLLDQQEFIKLLWERIQELEMEQSKSKSSTGWGG